MLRKFALIDQSWNVYIVNKINFKNRLSLNANKIEDLQSFKCFKVDTLLKLKHIGLLDNPIEKYI